MSSGTPALRRETVKRLELTGAKVVDVVHANNGHLRYTVRAPDGRVVKLLGSVSPRDATDCARSIVRDYVRALAR